MKNDAQQRIYRVMSAVLGVPLESLDETTGQKSIETWDSLAHIHLIAALESEFSISFTPEQALGMTSVSAIGEAVRGKAAADA